MAFYELNAKDVEKVVEFINDYANINCDNDELFKGLYDNSYIDFEVDYLINYLKDRELETLTQDEIDELLETYVIDIFDTYKRVENGEIIEFRDYKDVYHFLIDGKRIDKTFNEFLTFYIDGDNDILKQIVITACKDNGFIELSNGRYMLDIDNFNDFENGGFRW